MKSMDHNAFINEAAETINRIGSENSSLSELKWFLNTASLRFRSEYLNNASPQVIVLGNDIPAEIIRSVCDSPFYVLGGSLGTAHWADELTPRDTDPFSRSSLGWLVNPEFDITRDALIVTAITSDSRRKMISVLQNAGRNVAVMDIPPLNSNPNAAKYYKDQLLTLAEKISRYTGKPLTGRRLKNTVRMIDRAQYCWKRFRETVFSANGLITDEAALIVEQCMYFAGSLNEWMVHTSRLITETENLCKRSAPNKKRRPNVLVLGSPVVFPNYKVPQLISQAGMRIAAVADSLSLETGLAVPRVKHSIPSGRLLDQIILNHLTVTSSGARVNNRGLYYYFLHLVKQFHPDGIVYHILKGQIEYDFELPGIEKAAEEAGIPVFRLETDYQYQDMEQLRIRIEAFGEMLEQKIIVDQKEKRTA